MNPLLRTAVGLGTGWAASKGLAAIARLQGGPDSTLARKIHSRRAFTRNAALGATGIVVAQLGVAFGVLMWPNKTGAFGGELGVSADNIPAPGASPFRDQQGKFYIVRNEDGIQALYWKCTHLGCTVPWNEGEHQFHCPCHGSVFNIDGARTAGPATRRLDRMPVVVNSDGSITINTNPTTIEEAPGRTEYLPTDATPYP
ncbi:MAG TPA: Rieske (2Fe-2S) protein [Thermomicrobiales bacterium]|nr:Rieske (2Fe-2S) protein [Thermomicrobiales bacterium]